MKIIIRKLHFYAVRVKNSCIKTCGKSQICKCCYVELLNCTRQIEKEIESGQDTRRNKVVIMILMRWGNSGNRVLAKLEIEMQFSPEKITNLLYILSLLQFSFNHGKKEPKISRRALISYFLFYLEIPTLRFISSYCKCD